MPRPGSPHEVAIEYRIGPQGARSTKYEVILSEVQSDSELVPMTLHAGPRKSGPVIWRSEGVGPVALKWGSHDSLTVWAAYSQEQWKRRKTIASYTARGVRVKTLFDDTKL